MFIEIKKGTNIVVYSRDKHSKELSKSLWASSQMIPKQRIDFTESLVFHHIDVQHTNGISLTLSNQRIKHDIIGIR